MPLTSSSADAAISTSVPRVAVLDSGVGGLPYISWVFNRRPDGSYIYLADSRGFPYGSRNEENLIDLVIQRVDCLNSTFKPDLVLIACNTASVVALKVLRDKFSIPFVGVVPAVKPAAVQSRARKIGLIATSETVVSDYTNNLIAEFAADCTVFRYAGQGLVEFVEHRLTGADGRERMDAVAPACGFFRESGVDQVVLGCTHFIHLKEEFQNNLGREISVVDSVDGVGREVLRKISEIEKNKIKDAAVSEFSIYTTSEVSGSSYTDFAAFYGAEYKGVLQCR